MVLVINPKTSESNSESSLRTLPLKELKMEKITEHYSGFKFRCCNTTMMGCITAQNEYKACGKNSKECNAFSNYVTKPLIDSTCEFISDMCKADLDSTLRKLYEAGALTSDTVLTRQIDAKIQELNGLKHKVLTVSSNSSVNGKPAIEHKKDSISKTSEKTTKKEESAVVEEEETSV